VSLDTSLIEWIAEAMEPIGTVTHRRMMGGATLYCDGTVFAIIAMDALWFKGDEENDAIWDAEGCERFTYEFANGRVGSMNYRRAPDDVHDDADALRHWGRLGLEAGRRAPPKKPKATKLKPKA
jgi:DNA transformation protein and related proteins